MLEEEIRDGEEIVPTPEELQEKLVTAREEKTQLQTQLDEANEKLAKANDKDTNFSKLRNAKKNAEEELADYKEKTSTDIQSIRDEMQADKISSQISKLSGGNKEVADKIKFHFDKISGDTVEERLSNAAILANNIVKNNVNPANFSNKGGSAPSPYTTSDKKVKLSPAAKAVAGKSMGFSEEELKKY